MPELTTTFRTSVTEDQIDHLGHMNVRFYGAHARRGTDEILATLPPVHAGVVSAYTRHVNEQFVGAPLRVESGIVGVEAGRVHLYHELRNEENEALAAAFHHVVAARDEGAPAWPGPIDADRLIVVPEHGRSRSLDVATDPVASAPTLERVQELGLAMRRPRTVTDEECGADGHVTFDDAPGLLWGGEAVDEWTGPMFHEGPNGERIGWASMETRLGIGRLPVSGTLVQSFGATVALADKTSVQTMWSFDVERGDLLCTYEVVSLAFDTNTRRSLTIPDELRAQWQARLHPDLAAR